MDIFGNFSKLIGDKDTRKIAESDEREFSYSKVAVATMGKMESRAETSSLTIWKIIAGLIFCVMIGRLFILTVVQKDANERLAEGNRIRPRVIEASRGLIFDSSGNWLARNQPSFALAVYPSDLPRKKADREIIYQNWPRFVRCQSMTSGRLPKKTGYHRLMKPISRKIFLTMMLF